ncbi:MAG: VCBS repeat-containing protein, partial [Planctomycetes bacterium]|nr:VCBS repeat-containing protein [Planctomycetota bacterium]
ATVVATAGANYVFRGLDFAPDGTPPVINSITRLSGATNPTNAPSAQFTVTFSEAVSGVDASDFAMDVTGITGASVTTVTGSGTTYTVTVSTGSGDGTVSIDLAASPTVSDLASNALTTAFTNGEAYTLDRTAPVVNSITRANPAGQLTNATGLVWRVMLSEAIDASSLTVSDFMLTVLNGSVNGVIASVTPTSGLGNIGFDISVSGVVGNAEVRLVLSGPFSDLTGNIQTAGFASGESYLVDQKSPVILSIDRQLPTDAFTNQSSVTYRINFDEPVDPATFSIADLAPNLASGLTGGVITSLTAVAGSGDSSFDVGITNITGAGILRLDFTGSVADRQGNVRSQGFTGGQTYVIDRSPPTVVSITRIGTAATPMSSVNFVVTFNESIDAATLNPSDFAITRTGTASGTIGLIAPVTGNPSAFTITLTGLTGSGSIRPDIVQSSSISDLAGNTYQGPFTLGDSVTLTPVMARISPASAFEGSAINFVVSINQVLDINLSITLSPVAVTGGAQNGIDFDGSQRVVDIQAGQLSTIAAIPTISENLVELDEVFDVVISNMNATGRNTGIDQGTARGTIVNDDSSVVAINPAAALEGSNLAFTASLTNPVDVNVSMRISVEGSFSDTANRDDIPASQSGILTIAAGQVTGTFQMMTIQDEIVERDETVTVSARDLAAGGRAVSLPMPLATGTILNDDFARLTMVSGSAIEGALVPIRLVLDKRVDTDILLRLTPGIATGDTASRRDFADMPISVVIPAGSHSGTGFLPSIQDNLVERDEQLTLTGSQLNTSGRSVSLATPSARATIVNDDKYTLRIASTGAVRGQAAVFSTTINPGTPTVVSARIEMPFPGFTGALSIAQADVNDDGFNDVIYGAGAGLAGGQVRIFDGANGFLMTTISAFPGSARGVVVAAGDVDGNGVKDLIVASQGTAGLVRAYDARSRALLRSFTAFPGYSGMVAISAGDINGDRVDDIAVSVANGRLRVLNGRNGSVLRNITAFNSEAMANSIALADLNGDGLKEIVVGAAAGSAIMVYPPMSGGPAAFNAFAPNFRGGVRLVALDINGDGIDEIIATTGPGTRGLVRVFDNAYRVTDEFFSTHFGTREGSFIG